MLATILLVFIAVSVMLTLTNWRQGLPLAVLIGLVQDPIRKLTPGTPAILVLATLPVWAVIWHGAFGQERSWSRFRRADPRRARVIWAFILSLLPGTIVTFSYGLSAWPVAALGLFAYLAPLLTIVAGFMFPKTSRDVERFLAFYAATASAVLVGTFLEYSGLMPGWQALGTDVFGGDPWTRFTAAGVMFKLISGFFRSPDIASWHAAAVAMIGLTMAFCRPGARRPLWLVVAVWGGACLVITGRRKGIVMPFVWAVVVGAAFLRTQRLGMMLRLGLVSVVAAGGFYYASGELGIKSEYYGYAQSTWTDGPQRFVDGAWSGVWETFAQSGLLGSGIGTATQGGQHLAIHLADTWQESGPTKLAVELGLPGFVGAIFLAYVIVRSAATAVQRASDGKGASLPLGLLAFSAANAICFAISHQIYSDVTVLSVTAFLFGAVLSAPDWTLARRAAPTLASKPLWAQVSPTTRKIPV